MTTNADPGAPATGTETTTDEPVVVTIEPATGDDAKDWKAEHEKVLAASRKWEDRAKANAQAAKDLEEIRKQSMTDLDKAVAEARAEARTEALAEAGSKLVSAEIRAAAAGRNVDADALVDGINPARFLGDDGEPDRDAITTWLDKVAPVSTEPTIPGVPDLGQGGRGQPLALNGDPLEGALRSIVGAKR